MIITARFIDLETGCRSASAASPDRCGFKVRCSGKLEKLA